MRALLRAPASVAAEPGECHPHGIHPHMPLCACRYISPDVLAMPPPPGLLAALVPAPSKKRKSICERRAGRGSAGRGATWVS